MTAVNPSTAISAPAAQQAVVELRGSGVPASLVGGKAAALDRLIGWGLPVPPTAVVTAHVFRAVAQQPTIAAILARLETTEECSEAAVDRAFLDASLDTATEDQLVAAAERVAAGRRLAIRSSATFEDLARSSFAGQYRSTLNVDPSRRDELLSAVKLVWASMHHHAPRAYRAAMGVTDDHAAMCVVMMPIIPTQDHDWSRDATGG